MFRGRVLWGVFMHGRVFNVFSCTEGIESCMKGFLWTHHPRKGYCHERSSPALTKRRYARDQAYFVSH